MLALNRESLLCLQAVTVMGFTLCLGWEYHQYRKRIGMEFANSLLSLPLVAAPTYMNRSNLCPLSNTQKWVLIWVEWVSILCINHLVFNRVITDVRKFKWSNDIQGKKYLEAQGGVSAHLLIFSLQTHCEDSFPTWSRTKVQSNWKIHARFQRDAKMDLNLILMIRTKLSTDRPQYPTAGSAGMQLSQSVSKPGI